LFLDLPGFGNLAGVCAILQARPTGTGGVFF